MRYALAAAIIVSAWGQAADAEGPNPKRDETVVYCGGETDVATVQRFFSELGQALATDGPGKRFNKFVLPEFRVRKRDGTQVTFRVEDVKSVTPGYITIAEWQQVYRRGAKGLQNAGWRGCFLDHGKVWFNADENGFWLNYMKRDMPWDTPERGNAIP